MQFAIGEKDGVEVFIKFFSIPCRKKITRYKSLIRVRDDPKSDVNIAEIGLTKLLSSFMTMNPIPTQNLAFVYGSNYCDNAFGVTKSLCSDEELSINNHTLIPQGNNLPQCNFRSDYNNGNLDDRVNYMVVEKADGDLESLFDKMCDDFTKGMISYENFNEIWRSIVFQIILTVEILDGLMKPFYHGDMGLRNILFSKDRFVNHNNATYFEYIINGTSYKVKNCGFVPKLYDFSYMYIDERMEEKLKDRPEFQYFRDFEDIRSDKLREIPCIPQLADSFTRMENFHMIANTNFGMLMNVLREFKIISFDLLEEHFNVYNHNDADILLQPKFIYNGDEF